jgi:hypothetical protein
MCLYSWNLFHNIHRHTTDLSTFRMGIRSCLFRFEIQFNAKFCRLERVCRIGLFSIMWYAVPHFFILTVLIQEVFLRIFIVLECLQEDKIITYLNKATITVLNILKYFVLERKGLKKRDTFLLCERRNENTSKISFISCFYLFSFVFFSFSYQYGFYNSFYLW